MIPAPYSVLNKQSYYNRTIRRNTAPRVDSHNTVCPELDSGKQSFQLLLQIRKRLINYRSHCALAGQKSEHFVVLDFFCQEKK